MQHNIQTVIIVKHNIQTIITIQHNIYKYKHHTTQDTDNHHKIQHSDNHHRTQVQHADKFTIIIKYNIQTIFIQRKDNHHHTTQQIANHHTSQCKDNHQKLNMGPITIH